MPATLQEFTVAAIDGKVIKHIPHRLRPLRLSEDSAMKLLGGKSLVAVDLATGLPIDMYSDLDGEASEVPLFAPLLQRLEQRFSKLLVVADRGFGHLEQALQIQAANGHFVLRKHGSTTFIADPDSPAVETTDRYGRKLIDQSGELTRGKEQTERLAVRQLTIVRDRETLHLLSDLTDRSLYPADDLAEVYRHRWDAERVFAEITELFGLRHLIGTRPEAGLFQAAFCLILYGVTRVLRQHVAMLQKREAESLSSEMLWRDVRDDLSAAFRLIEVSLWLSLLEPNRSRESARARISELLSGHWKPAWLKSRHRVPDPSRPASPKPVRKKQSKGHNSVQRILNSQKTTG